jgi:hypothetical protein
MLQTESAMNSLISRDPQKMGMHKKQRNANYVFINSTLWEDSLCRFWYDLLVVMNVIRKLFWFMFIYLLDYPANTMKQETFHQVKWWYTFGNLRCCAKCQPWHHLTAQNSSELDNTEMVNSLKCCKWKVSSILWSNHQHQQRPSEKWGCTRNKGMQIMFSSTPNSAQEEPNSIQIFCFSTLHYSDNKEVPCIVTVPWFSWVSSFDEWWSL